MDDNRVAKKAVSFGNMVLIQVQRQMTKNL